LGALPDGLPASWGGIAGLLGAGAIEALAGACPSGAAVDPIGLGLASLVAGAALAARVFAFDWARLMTLPDMLRRARRASGRDANPFKPRSERRASARRAARRARRRSARAGRPRSPTRAAAAPREDRRQGQQQDLFDTYQLPSLDLLEDPPAETAPKLDKLALERNARLLENVLDDFNVKGEITAVRTGPVVTMYELEPAPRDQGQPGDRPRRGHRPQHERDLGAASARSRARR
jgi:S-DNA-T family DNA segregation ATPase FtsK/SpoIIIE